jgi:hypothetical protein
MEIFGAKRYSPVLVASRSNHNITSLQEAPKSFRQSRNNRIGLKFWPKNRKMSCKNTIYKSYFILHRLERNRISLCWRVQKSVEPRTVCMIQLQQKQNSKK